MVSPWYRFVHQTNHVNNLVVAIVAHIHGVPSVPFAHEIPFLQCDNCGKIGFLLIVTMCHLHVYTNYL